ncbi:MAG: hypothetical protein QXH20_01945 [Candidatus Bathyarchaeia archaeon]
MKFFKVVIISSITLLSTFYSLLLSGKTEEARFFLSALCVFYLILFLICFLVKKLGEKRWKRN